jgi:alkaline phosphatase
LNSRAGIAWGTWAHTAQPVPVFAIGAGAELFEGYYDNTDIPKKIAKAMGISFPE